MQATHSHKETSKKSLTHYLGSWCHFSALITVLITISQTFWARDLHFRNLFLSDPNPASHENWWFFIFAVSFQGICLPSSTFHRISLYKSEAVESISNLFQKEIDFTQLCATSLLKIQSHALEVTTINDCVIDA